MKKLIPPKKLNSGDKIAVVSLSWGGPGTYPYRYEVGKERLESLFGLEVLASPHALKDPIWIYQHPEARARDLMEAFLDPTVKGIFSSIGGDDSIRLLPYIDYDIIRRNPKIFLGYSDSTVTHFMCVKAGITSFYGPAVLTAFAENVSMHDYSIRGIKDTLFSNKVIDHLPLPGEGWTKEFLDWNDPANQNRRRKLHAYSEWSFIGCTNTVVQGRLVGGCVEVLQMMNATELWPSLDVWDECVLFLETSEEGMSPLLLKRFLRNMASQGILQKVSGILFSKPGGADVVFSQFSGYDDVLLEVFNEFQIPLIPIVTNMDFGHSDPMWTLPYGILTEINPIAKTVRLLESGVS